MVERMSGELLEMRRATQRAQLDPHVHPNPAHVFCCQPLATHTGQKHVPDPGTLPASWKMWLPSRAFLSQRDRAKQLSFPEEKIVLS